VGAAEIENEISDWIHQIGEDTQQMVIEKMDQRRAKGKKKCPKCGAKVYWKRYEVRNYITSLGEMKLAERAYYYHAARHCGWLYLGWCPGVFARRCHLGTYHVDDDESRKEQGWCKDWWKSHKTPKMTRSFMSNLRG